MTASRDEPEPRLREQLTDCRRWTEALGAAGVIGALLDAAPDAIVAVAPDGLVVIANAQAERLFGYGCGELVGVASDALVPVRFRGGHPARPGSFFAGPRVLQAGPGNELFALARDGREFPVEVGMSSVETSAGRLVIAVLHDVGARREAELDAAAREAEADELRERAAVLEGVRSVADAAPVGILACAEDGTGRYLNARWCELAGLDRERCLAGEWWARVDPQDLPRLRSAWHAVRAGGSAEFEFRFRHPDGRAVSVLGSGSPGAADGEVILSVSDVTARRPAVWDDGETARWLRTVLEHGPVGLAFRDLQGRYVHANAAFADAVGSTVERLLGNPLDAVLPPALCDQIRDADRQLFATGEPVRGELGDVVERPDGRGRRFSSVRHLVRDEAGTVQGIAVFLVEVTERRRAELALLASERELRKSRAQLDALLDHAPLAITLRDLDGQVLLANRLAEEIFKDDPADVGEGLAGQGVSSHERDVAGRHSEAPGAGSVDCYEVSRIEPSGERRDYLARKYPVCDVDGTVIGIGGVAVDITERKRAEALSGEFASIIASTDDAVIGTTLAGEITSWNPAAGRIYGYAVEEALGRHISFLVPPARTVELDVILARLADGERVEHLETVRLHRDGRELDMSLAISPIFDGDGAVIGASTIARDITKQKALAEQLRASEQLLRTTVDHAPIGIAIISLDGRWLRVNPAMAELTGCTEADLLAGGSPMPGHPDCAQIFRESIRGLLAGAGNGQFEKRFVHPDGTTRWLSTAVSLVRDEHGAPMRFVAQAQDITERRSHLETLATHSREQEALRSLATLVASESPPRAVVAAAAERVAEILQADFGAVARLEPTGQARLIGSWSAAGLPEAPLGVILDLDAATAVSTTLRTGQPSNIAQYGNARSHPWLPVRSGIAAPIQVNGTLWGALSVGWQREAVADPCADERMARVADLVSLAIASAEAREQLSRLASTDHLTGLYNQRAFSDRLDNEVDRARRHGRPLSLVVFDLDHFKLVNDTHGHEVGNRALAEFSKRLLAVRRSGEILARVGGEEFAWILPDTNADQAFGAAERARRAIADTPFIGIGRMTTSAGVCALEDAADASELFRHADLALYWAKARGRNATIRYAGSELSLLSPDEQASRLERARTLAAIRALAAAIDAKDPSTQRHSERVAALAARLAKAAGWPDDRIALLRDAALVHDVGKIAVPDQILLKPTSLTPAEYELVKGHTTLGAQMLEDLLQAEQLTWIRHHHERYDGGGYPDGLAGVQIPDGARLLAIADAWDAMTVARSYGAPRSTEDALAEMHRRAAAQFCPDTIDVLTELHRSGELH